MIFQNSGTNRYFLEPIFTITPSLIMTFHEIFKRTNTFTTKFEKNCRHPGGRKVDPVGDWICRIPAPLEVLSRFFVQERLPPELPRATRPPQGAHKRTNIFTKFQNFPKIANRAGELKLNPWRFYKMPNRSKTTPGPQEPNNIAKNRLLQNS